MSAPARLPGDVELDVADLDDARVAFECEERGGDELTEGEMVRLRDELWHEEMQAAA